MTDEESKYMKHAGGHGKHLSYNAQISVDKKGIILEADVVTKASEDGELLKDRVKGVEESTKKKVKKVVADNGYYETNAVKEIIEGGRKCIVPKQETQEKDKENFKYNKEKNTYKCEEGKELKYVGKKNGRGKTFLVYAAKKEDCMSCSLIGQCYKGKGLSKYGRRIMIYEDKKFMDSYRRILKRNKILYNKRKSIVEPVIGTIKSALRFRRFALRGLEKVKSEWNLITTVFNLMKIRKIIIDGNRS